MRIGFVQIKVRKYADGRWGFDDYTSGKRRAVRWRSKQKAEAYARDIGLLLTNGRPAFLDVIQKNGFAPVPPPRLYGDQIRKNERTLPNKSGIYFIWEGPVIAYVGQSINLARRLLGHEHLRPTDKVSYLCIDSSELFYHEAFYIGICRPFRNGGTKKEPKPILSGTILA
jgi:hypothetical protein